MRNLAKKFKALSNERRLKIVAELLKYKKLTVGEIADKINLSFRSTSRHLKILEAAGFVNWQQTGLNVYYSISLEASEDILKLVKKHS